MAIFFSIPFSFLFPNPVSLNLEWHPSTVFFNVGQKTKEKKHNLTFCSHKYSFVQDILVIYILPKTVKI